jgi:hypothetical protein
LPQARARERSAAVPGAGAPDVARVILFFLTRCYSDARAPLLQRRRHAMPPDHARRRAAARYADSAMPFRDAARYAVAKRRRQRRCAISIIRYFAFIAISTDTPFSLIFVIDIFS